MRKCLQLTQAACIAFATLAGSCAVERPAVDEGCETTAQCPVDEVCRLPAGSCVPEPENGLIGHFECRVGESSAGSNAQLIGTLSVIAPRDLYRITCITYVDKLYAFYNASGVHIKTGDNTFRKTHDAVSASLRPAQLIGEPLCLGQVKRTFVNCPAGNCTHDALISDLA